ncbi:MAG: adenosylhomocysteinase [Actinomycetota bacterium]|nr:adenosylhomocysteinase [Actinomycetota bacterium]
MTESLIADARLAADGERKIDWAATWMPVMNRVRAQLEDEGSVRGRRVAVILPIEPKTAYLAATLAAAGAQVAVAFQGAMVHDDVAAGLAARGVEVFARRGSTREEELEFFEQVLERRPEVVIDDRADVIRLAHTTHREVLEDLLGASEETTSGVIALRAMEADGTLAVPCIAANDARCKYLFDNRYGSGQSTVAALLDATNLLMAGKQLAVVGYGWVGKGIARRARGMGARVIVCEVDPFSALEAHHDGFAVLPVAEACAVADFVMTATGVRDALPLAAIERLKDGAVLANTGGIDDEFDVPKLRARALETRVVRRDVEEFRLEEGRSIFVVGGGVVVNLSAGEGHPVEIMDLTFAVQALSARHLLLHAHELAARVHALPPEIDERIARMKLDALRLRIDDLTPAQQSFLKSWEAF